MLRRSVSEAHPCAPQVPPQPHPAIRYAFATMSMSTTGFPAKLPVPVAPLDEARERGHLYVHHRGGRRRVNANRRVAEGEERIFLVDGPMLEEDRGVDVVRRPGLGHAKRDLEHAVGAEIDDLLAWRVGVRKERAGIEDSNVLSSQGDSALVCIDQAPPTRLRWPCATCDIL